MVERVTGAISDARAKGERRPLVAPKEVTGFPPPKLTARHQFLREWARASEGKVRMAVVTTAEMIDPGRFGVTVAANAGMEADVFADENEALEWLVG